MKFLIYIARIVVGSVFVVSGLIKANDALGFSYKLEEYFEPAALGSFWTMFESFALPIAILVCVAEVVLGLSLLFGTKYKLTVILITGFLVFFGFLTYYTAQCDPHEIVSYLNESGETITTNRQCVLDCGCFGDALKGSLGRSLTPWESFKKDMILLVFTVFLFFGFKTQRLNNERKDKIILIGALLFTAGFGGYIFGWWLPLAFLALATILYLLIKWFYVKKGREWIIITMLIGISGAFAWYTLTYLPVKDYRPYAIGNNLAELRKTSEDYKQEIMDAEFAKNMPQYSTTIEKETMEILATDSLYLIEGLSDSLKNLRKAAVMQEITYKYEDIVMQNADAFAMDSLKRANLLPPVYANMYYLQHKETGERKKFSSTVYIADKLYENWDFVYVLVNKETGDIQEVEKKNYKEAEWTAKGYKKQKSPDPFVEIPGYEPKIPLDFDFNDDAINADILGSEEYLLLVVTWDLSKSVVNSFEKVNELYTHAQAKGYKFYAATSKDYLAEDFKKANNVEFDFASADEKILKTIIRSNPGVVLLKGGVVLGKWDKNRIPSPKKLEKYISKLK